MFRDWQAFSIKSQRVNTLDFVGHKVSVATTQFCCCIAKTAKNEIDCGPKKILPKKMAVGFQ